MEFVRYLASALDKAGIAYDKDDKTQSGIVENSGYVNFQIRMRDGQVHKVYVPKNKGTIGRVETTIFFDPSNVKGVKPLPSTAKKPNYKNGFIRSHLEPDKERVARLVIEAVKKGAPVPVKRVATRGEAGQPAQETEVRPTDQRDRDPGTPPPKEERELHALHPGRFRRAEA
jgi:hypothetical protein